MQGSHCNLRLNHDPKLLIRRSLRSLGTDNPFDSLNLLCKADCRSHRILKKIFFSKSAGISWKFLVCVYFIAERQILIVDWNHQFSHLKYPLWCSKFRTSNFCVLLNYTRNIGFFCRCTLDWKLKTHNFFHRVLLCGTCSTFNFFWRDNPFGSDFDLRK